jgi:hypothetical protein
MNNPNLSHSHTKELQTAHALISDPAAAAEHGVAADRFAREIIAIRIMYVSVPGDGEVELLCSGIDRASKC